MASMTNGDHSLSNGQDGAGADDGDGKGSCTTQTDVLIIGAGPAGASLACFLASHGIVGTMVSRASGTADTPRAHITNMAALECLRDIDLERDCLQVSTDGDCMMHTRWCHSMAGQEFARIYSWGNDPNRKGDYELASPCQPCDLPQTLLEPVLVRHATTHGFKCRWNTSLVSFCDLGPGAGVVTTLRDDLTGQEYQIRSKYLFGADGARSRVVSQLQLPLLGKAGGGPAINVLVRADLSHLVQHRKGNLHWVMQPDSLHRDFAQMAIVRMVKPWYEWMFILLPKPDWDGSEPTNDQYLQQVQAFIGDESIPVQILGISKWFINETVAEQYSSGNVFCLGDAVHRHPPFNGLGSNTCIQDAFNLAWKIAYVDKGKAAPSLLSTYSTERQPVGHSVIVRANNGFREHSRIWDALGMLMETVEDRRVAMNQLSEPSIKGRERRKALRNAVQNSCHEFHGLGIEMNQTYTGMGVYADDEQSPFTFTGRAAEDPILYHMRGTYPGRRLPHAWLNRRVPNQAPTSTIDLAGKGAFTLFTGLGGTSWLMAGMAIERQLPGGVRMNVHSIGIGQDWEDVYGEWEAVREVHESGVILVRPDRFVAWRAQECSGDPKDCELKLMTVMQKVLGLSSMNCHRDHLLNGNS